MSKYAKSTRRSSKFARRPKGNARHGNQVFVRAARALLPDGHRYPARIEAFSPAQLDTLRAELERISGEFRSVLPGATIQVCDLPCFHICVSWEGGPSLEASALLISRLRIPTHVPFVPDRTMSPAEQSRLWHGSQKLGFHELLASDVEPAGTSSLPWAGRTLLDVICDLEDGIDPDEIGMLTRDELLVWCMHSTPLIREVAQQLASRDLAA